MQSVRIVVIVGLLAAATLAVHGQTAGFDPLTPERTAFEFVNLDDPGYVFDHPHVVTGITGENVGWAFRTTYFSNWHPLTWLSYMLDAELYRPDPRMGIHQLARGFHATNVALHLGSVLLLFVVLRSLTGAEWRSAAVAGLFAIHPLHVESVAWISERKDVLSVFFGLIAIAAYVRYVRSTRTIDGKGDSAGWCSSNGLWYAVALLAFAASLMSKQMLVTLPFVLLLLDWWPLKRIADWSALWSKKPHPAGDAGSVPAEPVPSIKAQHRRHRKRYAKRDMPTQRASAGAAAGAPSPKRIILEKLPFLALSLAACVVAVIAQRTGGALQTFEQHPPMVRVLNAILSYGLYLKKLFWPTQLAVFYPHPGDSISLARVAVAGVLLVAVTAACWRLRNRRSYLLMGWLWFLGTLVPVIGLVQVGEQQMADRYAYFPAIGVYVAVVWMIASLIEAGLDSPREIWGLLRLPLAVGIAAAYIVLIGLGWLQTSHWKDSETLFQHALAVEERNAPAHLNLASFYDDRATVAEQRDEARAAREFLERAVRHDERAVEIDPLSYDAHYNLGTVLVRQAGFLLKGSNESQVVEAVRRNLRRAIDHFQEADAIRPGARNRAAAQLYVNWGAAWLTLAAAGGTTDEEGRREAKLLFEQALVIDPDFAEAHGILAKIFLEQGQPDEARRHFERVWRTTGREDPDVHRRLMIEYLRQNRRSDALRHARRAHELDPSLPDPETLLRRAAAFRTPAT